VKRSLMDSENPLHGENGDVELCARTLKQISHVCDCFLLLLLYCYWLHVFFCLSCTCYSLLASHSSFLLVGFTYLNKKAIKHLNF